MPQEHRVATRCNLSRRLGLRFRRRGLDDRGQARRLWDRASELGEGARIVEIGSFRGRSHDHAGLRRRRQEPRSWRSTRTSGTDRGPQEIVRTTELGESDNEVFNRNLTKAGVHDRVRHVRKLSAEALDDVEGPIDLLYIDGAHRYGPAHDDMVDWGARVGRRGHAPRPRLVELDRCHGRAAAHLPSAPGSGATSGAPQSMAEYRRGPLDAKQRRASALRQLGELPWFARNVSIKVLLSLHLGKLTKVLGHDGKTWPY